MSWIAVLARDEFIAWIGGNFYPEIELGAPPLRVPPSRVSDIFLWWPDEYSDTRRENAIIVLPDEGVREFYAFASTYMSSFVPITAFHRVLSLSSTPAIRAAAVNADEHAFPPELVGVVLADAAQDGRDLGELSIHHCQSTLSYAVLSALRLGYDEMSVISIGRSIQNIRRLFSVDEARGDANAFLPMWQTVASAINLSSYDDGQSKLTSVIREFMHYRAMTEDIWFRLCEPMPELMQVWSRMQGSREDRVRTFDHSMEIILGANYVERSLRELMAGLLAAMVSQGSLQYLSFLKQYLSVLPAANGWFSFFSSMLPATDALSAADGLGQRLDIILRRPRNMFDALKGDVSYEELLVIGRGAREEWPFRTEFPLSIGVELLPGVLSRYTTQDAPSAHQSIANLINDISEAKVLISQAGRVVERLEKVALSSSRGGRGHGSRGRPRVKK